MAIRITPDSGSFVQDRDANVFIGVDLPFRKSEGVEGYFASTTTTIQAVKNDITNLLNTEIISDSNISCWDNGYSLYTDYYIFRYKNNKIH